MLVAMAEGASSQAPVSTTPMVDLLAWVYKYVLDIHFEMTCSEVESLADGGKWVHGSHACRLTVVHCNKKERVCHAAKKGEEPFIYIYKTMLLDLGVSLPFEFFEVDILRMLGIVDKRNADSVSDRRDGVGLTRSQTLEK
ncbi:hypothetical protein CR513_51172, partial [Mucuna pruriens]